MTQSERLHVLVLEDSICYDPDDWGLWGAVCYDTDRREFFTAAYGHGQDYPKHWVKDFSYEKLMSLYSLEELFDIMVKNICNRLGGTVNCFSAAPYSKCSVTGGAKMKGENLIFIGIRTVSGPVIRGYNRDKCYAIVYDPETDTLCKSVNPCFVNVSYDTDRLINKVKEAFISGDFSGFGYIKSREQWICSYIHRNAYAMSYAHVDSINERATLADLFPIHLTSMLGREFCGVTVTEDLVKNAKDPWEADRLAKKNAKYADRLRKKEADLWAWADRKLEGESQERKQQVVDKLLNRYRVEHGLV